MSLLCHKACSWYGWRRWPIFSSWYSLFTILPSGKNSRYHWTEDKSEQVPNLACFFRSEYIWQVPFGIIGLLIRRYNHKPMLRDSLWPCWTNMNSFWLKVKFFDKENPTVQQNTCKVYQYYNKKNLNRMYVKFEKSVFGLKYIYVYVNYVYEIFHISCLNIHSFDETNDR